MSPISTSIPVTVTAASSVQPALVEDYNDYPGADEAAKTTAYRNNVKNIYRAGEDFNLQRQHIVYDSALGKYVMQYRYPGTQYCADYTISRSIDLDRLQANTKEVWWHMRQKFSSNMDMWAPNCPVGKRGPGMKWMHGGVQGPNSGRFAVEGVGRTLTNYQGRPFVYKDSDDPQNQQFLTIKTSFVL